MRRGGRQLFRFGRLSCVAVLLIMTILPLLLQLDSVQEDNTYSQAAHIEIAAKIDSGPGSIPDTPTQTISNKTNISKVQDAPTSGSMWSALDPQKPIFAHVLAYQRTGSTFFGDLFNEKPGVFFIYEPLDALYSAVYGTKPGWNVPSDIFTDSNGRVRPLPQHEIEGQQWVLDTIFNCKMSTLPTAMLIHPFWQMFRFRMHVAELYHSCIGRKTKGELKNIKNLLEECQEPIRDICPSTFDGQHENFTLCHRVLWNDGQWATMKNFDYKLWSEEIGERSTKKFEKYFQCLAKYDEIVHFCAQLDFDRKCEEKNIRMVKTVRSNMEIPGNFLKKYTNYRLLHFFRDPRGTVRSRLHPNATWSLGTWEKQSLQNAAQGYCQLVQRDLLKQLLLKHRYKGQTLQVTFDGHTQDPDKSTATIYSFVNATHLASNEIWHLKRKGLELKGANATLVAAKWRSEMPQRDIDIVNKACRGFLEYAKFPL